MENTEISSIISKPMNRTISKLDLGITAYNFRHLWVNYIVEHKRQLLDNIPFGGKTIDWDSVRDVIIYTILLGHDENDLQTQNSYKSISII